MGYGTWEPGDGVRTANRGVGGTADSASESWVVGVQESSAPDASDPGHAAERPDGWPLGLWVTMATQMVREASTPYGAKRDSAESVDRPHDLSDLEGLSHEEFVAELGSRIIRVAAHSSALDYRLLVMIAEFDRRKGWDLDGHRDCAAWLENFTGMSRITARERVRVARKLVGLPRISNEIAHGRLSYSKVRALVRVATPDNEAELLPMASESTAHELERQVSEFRELERWGELDAERLRHAKRALKVVMGKDGMVRLLATLPPEVGALLIKILDAAIDALFRSNREWSPEAGRWGLATEDLKPDQLRADALRLILDRAMAAGFADIRPRAETDSAESRDDAQEAGTELTTDSAESQEDELEPAAKVSKLEAGPVGSPGDPRKPGAKANNDSAESVSGATGPTDAGCGCVPPSPSAERYMVMVNVPYQTLTGKGVADVDGLAIPSETARRLACDASVVRIVRGPSGEVLDVGRRTRTIPPAIRRALWARDGGCAFPGCGLRYVSAHHIRHWADGGPTSLDNLVLLCPSHHRGVHETGFTVKLGRDRLPRFFNRAGVRIPNQAPPPALGPDPVAETLRTHRLRGVDPDDWTGVCRRQVSDENWLRFQEALDPSDP